MTVDLHFEAATLGVVVETRTPPNGKNGVYDDAGRLILLHPVLTSWQERSTLAHELSHARWRDTGFCPNQEARADVEAARALITVDEYAAAEKEVGPEPAALAEYLGVCTWVVEVWQREASVGRAWTKRARRRR